MPVRSGGNANTGFLIAIILILHQSDRKSASPEMDARSAQNGPAPVPLFHPGRASPEFSQSERRSPHRAVGADPADPASRTGARLSAVRSRQARRSAYRRLAPAARTLAAPPG